ncbi:MAG: CCA tRNA nucleotidyltransferase [Gemmatimonadota bacterium]
MNTLELAAPAAVRDIATRLENAGFETWAVGGAVRDALIGMQGGDWDLATRARPADVQNVFRRTVPIGIEHGTVGVLAQDGRMYEVTTFRRDIETFGRHAVVQFADSIEHDLARRDFTFNAIAWHPLTHELRDPYGGFEDLRAARLRTVGEPAERFAEDYLRILRALRFAGHFVLTIESRTWAALVAAKQHLRVLSAERIREELWKIFTRTPHASAALKLYASAGVLAELYPELDALVRLETETGVPVWTRTLAAVDALPRARPVLRMTALLHAVGMPAARSKDLRGEWRFTGHEARGARAAEAITRRLKASNADTERVAKLVAIQSDLFPPDAPDAGVRRWLLHVPAAYVNDLFRLRLALCRAASASVSASASASASASDLTGRWRHAHRVLLQHPVLDTAGLAIGGKELKALGLAPGPEFGALLNTLVQRVIDDPALNQPDRLMQIVKDEIGA